MEEPTTLQTPNAVAPFSFTNLRAAKVSAVSPDWEITITKSSGYITGFLYLNSEAYSTKTGTSAISSKKYFASSPACQLVPQARIIILFAFNNLSTFSMF